MRSTLALAAVAATFMTTGAWAQNAAMTPTRNPWYFGGGAGMGVLHKSGGDLTGLDNAQLDNNDTSYTVRGGYRFSPFGAVELGYSDFGRYHFSSDADQVSGSGRATSADLSLVGIIPYQQFDFYGRLGWAHSKLSLNANGPLPATANHNERQDELAYGLGVRWWFAPQWGAFVEWQKNDRIRIDSYVAGIDFRF